MRCHLGVGPQERTAEGHTTRGPRKTLATFGRVTLGGTVSRGWSLSTVRCEGGTCLARTLTTSGSRQKSSMSCSPESMEDDSADRNAINYSTSRSGSRAGTSEPSNQIRLAI